MVETGSVNDAIFNALTEKPEGDSILAEAYDMFFDVVADGDFASMLVLADWLDDKGKIELAEAIRYELSPMRIRQHFADLMFPGEMLRYRHDGFYTKSRLAAARELALKAAIALLPGWAEKQAMRAINNFTRAKMREDGFYRRIMSATPITNAELDRQVDTDKPIKVMDHG